MADKNQRYTVLLSNSLSKKLSAYRAARFDELGRRITSARAISELVERALDGVTPAAPLADRITELEDRVERLEHAVCEE